MLINLCYFNMCCCLKHSRVILYNSFISREYFMMFYGKLLYVFQPNTITIHLFSVNWVGNYAKITLMDAKWKYHICEKNTFSLPSNGLCPRVVRATKNRFHDDVIKWKHFPRNWPFVREIHRSPVNFPHKGQWRGALMFSLIYAWINDWVNNREAGDLRRQHGHYDVIVMQNHK